MENVIATIYFTSQLSAPQQLFGICIDYTLASITL